MKLSIITINLNNKKQLLRTLVSIGNQIDRNFEHIIIDGASNDGSIEIIKEYASHYDNVRWISEPDSGIYNAMNKGARIASADYVLYINSGDELYASNVVQIFNEMTETADMILGEVMAIYNNNRKQKWKHDIFDEGFPSLMSFYNTKLLHQAAFIKRSLQLKFPYDESYRIAGDYHFYIKNAINNDCQICVIKLCVAKFYLDGISMFENPTEEIIKARNELLPERIIRDYSGLTADGIRLLKRLSKFRGFRNLILKFINILISCYSFLQDTLKHIHKQN